MRVLIVNTSEKTGGAAIAASRLKEALINNGVKAKMLVRRKVSDNLSVVGLKPSLWLKYKFLKERFDIWLVNGLSREHLFDIDTGSEGTDITSLPEYKEADVIHLHWINQGMLSLRGLQKIVLSGKPIVWTMHDMWPFTGICHYSRACHHFIDGCHDCPLLKHAGKHDLSYRTFTRKERLLQNAKITFVACSRWLAGRAQESYLLRGQTVQDIPNPINTNLYRPRDKAAARAACRLPKDKRLIMFSAFRTTSPIKGLKYFVEALSIYNERHPGMQDQIGIVAVGKDAETLAGEFPYPVYPMGYIEDEHRMAQIYNAVDAFVIPSLQDNLPNTIVEAMASGVPCIATAVGGIPQMINHLENGYLATAGQAADIAKGLEWLFGGCDYNAVAQAARAYAAAEYSEHNVAMRYIDIYNNICNKYYE